jgi:hypothetical protein
MRFPVAGINRLVYGSCGCGSVLILISYALPWVTYRVIDQPGGTVEMITWTGWGEASAGSPVALLVFGFPLLVAVLITGFALRQASKGVSRPSRGWSTFLAILDSLAFLAAGLLLYWLAQPDSSLSPEPAPQPGIGALLLMAGFCLLCIGACVLCFHALGAPNRRVPGVALQ